MVTSTILWVMSAREVGTMSDLKGLWQWQAELATRRPGLSVAQVRVLAEWSLGMVLGGRAP